MLDQYAASEDRHTGMQAGRQANIQSSASRLQASLQYCTHVCQEQILVR